MVMHPEQGQLAAVIPEMPGSPCVLIPCFSKTVAHSIFRAALQFLFVNLSLGTSFNPLIQPCLRSAECYIYLTLFEISGLFRMLRQENRMNTEL